MGYTLACQVRMINGISHGDKGVLTQLALATPKDSNTVNVRLDTLAGYCSCSERTARRSLRQLEKSGYLTPMEEARGRGHILRYLVNVTVESVEPKPVEEKPTIPPTNGHIPTNGHKPHVPAPPDVLVPDGLSPENQEFLQRVRQTQAERQEQQERYIQLNGKPNPALQEWIERSQRQIERLERRE